MLRLLQEDEKREIHVGFAGGYTMRALARRLARLLRRPAENLGRKKVIFHAIVAGFDLYEPTTDPNAFFSFFVNDPAMQVETAFVGLHAPALVTPKQYRTLREMHGINEAFDHARKIDILVTSAGCAADPHSLLKHYAAVSQESYDEMMRKECIGDMFWRPLGPSGPIESDAAVRAMTIMELSDLSGFIQKKKRVLLVAGPCGECAAPKTDVVKAILDAEERLITHLVVDSRCARGLVGT